MNQHIKRLADEARKLSPDERAELVDEILAGLHDQDGAWEKAWAEEADRRWAQYKSGAITSHDADAVLADVAKQLAKRRTK